MDGLAYPFKGLIVLMSSIDKKSICCQVCGDDTKLQWIKFTEDNYVRMCSTCVELYCLKCEDEKCQTVRPKHMITIKPNCPDNLCCYCFCCTDTDCSTGKWWGISREEHLRRYDGMFASDDYPFITSGYIYDMGYTQNELSQWSKWILFEIKYHHRNAIDLDHFFKSMTPSYKKKYTK